MLSKKYYKALAQLLGESSDLKDFERRLVNFLLEDNDRFDRIKFINACLKAYEETH